MCEQKFYVQLLPKKTNKILRIRGEILGEIPRSVANDFADKIWEQQVSLVGVLQ